MRKIGKTHNKSEAHIISNYLTGQKIDNMLREAQQGKFVIWIQDEDKLDDAKVMYDEFIANPQNPRYQNIVVKKAKPKRKRNKKVTIVLGPQYPYLTQILIIVCIIITIAVHKNPKLLDYLIMYGNPFIDRYWTILTPILVHIAIDHLFMNMLALNYLGSMLEGKHGTIFYLTQIVVIATISNIAEFIASGGNFCGISGVSYGFFGYIWIRYKLDKHWDLALNSFAIYLGVIWFFLCWFAIDNIANYGHTAGLLSGLLWGYLASKES